MKENVKKIDMKRSTDSWTKIGDLRHTLIQYLLQQNRFGTGKDETIEKEEDVRRHAGDMPLLTDLSLAMSTGPLALVIGHRSHGVRDGHIRACSRICVP